jgi:hypothetical protein
MNQVNVLIDAIDRRTREPFEKIPQYTRKLNGDTLGNLYACTVVRLHPAPLISSYGADLCMPRRRRKSGRKIKPADNKIARDELRAKGGSERFQLEDDVNRHLQLPQASETASNQLHPAVHKAAAVLFIWFVAAAWLLFSGGGYIDLAFAVISMLVFVVLAILVALWRVKQRSDARSTVATDSHAVGRAQSLGTWLHGEFATHSGREKGSVAAMEILLPIAAVAFGITVLGIVFALVRAGVL